MALPPNSVIEAIALDGFIAQLPLDLVLNTDESKAVAWLAIELAERTGDKVELKFSVHDTGMGMTPEQAGRLFQPFTQADGSSTRKHGGAALGLTLTKRYCEMLGGSLSVESTLNVGTVFTAALPLARAPLPESAS